MRDFQRAKQEILDRIGLADVVQEHVSVKRRGNRLVGLCPFHSEKTPSFTVSADLGLFKCFGCGKGGDLFTFVQEREGISFVEALELLADRVGVTIQRTEREKETGVNRSDVARACAFARDFFRERLLDESAGKAARDHLSQRGFTDATLERFEVGLSTEGDGSLLAAARKAGFSDAVLIEADLARTGDSGRVYETFRHRIMFPICDATGRPIGFGGRTLIDDPAKYLNTRENVLFDKGRTLFGLHIARDAMKESGRAIIVEGYTDCMAAFQAGFAETVAALGTAMTDRHAELIRRYCDEVVLLFDADSAGQAAAGRALRVCLPRSVACRLASLPEGKDPGDFLQSGDVSGFSDVLNHARDALEFVWSQTRDRFSEGGSLARRRDAVLDFLRIVAECCVGGSIDAIQRGLLINQIAHLLSLDAAEVRTLLADAERRIASSSATGGSAGSRQSAMRPIASTEWRQLLQVALCESGVLLAKDRWPDPDGIDDERDRRIAHMIFDLAQRIGEFTLADVLSACRVEGDAEYVASLAQRGLDRGNFEATLDIALSKIERAAAEVSDALRAWERPAQSEDACGGNTRTPGELRGGGKPERRVFTPRGKIRRGQGGGV